MTHVARALELDESRGFMKALVDPESGTILGAAVLGIEGGELMAALQLAMMGKLPYDAPARRGLRAPHAGRVVEHALLDARDLTA